LRWFHLDRLENKTRNQVLHTHIIVKIFIARDPNMIFSWELVMRKKDQIVLSYLGHVSIGISNKK
jgi:hypothetical protein